ncbi:MAG: hypothetical protein ACI9OJ_000780 [Myxococcota bacterium]|jgi:hypothetical protein
MRTSATSCRIGFEQTEIRDAGRSRGALAVIIESNCAGEKGRH